MSEFGYAGKILRVDLSLGTVGETSTMEYADFLGGRGIAAKIYWDEVSPDVDAADAENRLVFATGPLAGLHVLGTSRWTVCGKSPHSTPEHFSYSNLGGTWGAALKFAGYDALVISGKSEKPVYVLLRDGVCELRDASHLWGKGSVETRDIIKSQLGKSVRVVAIGPAGENKVPMATLLADNDASGSGGLGATMGAKSLKAVAIQGTNKGTKVARPERLRELTEYFRGLKRIPLPISANRWTSEGDPMLDPKMIPGHRLKKDPCYGYSKVV